MLNWLGIVQASSSDSTGSTGMATRCKRTNSFSSFEMDLNIKGYHEYKEIWTPTIWNKCSKPFRNQKMWWTNMGQFVPWVPKLVRVIGS